MASLAAVWGITVACESLAQSSPRPAFIEDQIAGIRIGLDRSDAIVKQYGRGFRTPSSPGEEFCYWDESRQLAVRFMLDRDGLVAGIQVTAIRENVGSVCRAADLKIKRSTTTGKMIDLGDSVEKVLAVYGQPGSRLEQDHRGRRVVGLDYEVQHERTPGVARWYWAGLMFLDGKLSELLVIESKESVSKIMRGE